MMCYQLQEKVGVEDRREGETPESIGGLGLQGAENSNFPTDNFNIEAKLSLLSLPNYKWQSKINKT